jgi:hypothetical protein
MLRSMRALPRVCLKATSPSSHVVITPSLLFNSSSQARSCSCSSSSTVDVIAVPRGGEGLHTPTSDDQHHVKRQAQPTARTSRCPTCSPPRPGWGQLPFSSGEAVAIGRHGWGPHSKGACHGVIPGHLEHGDGARFEMRGKEVHCCSDSPKIEMVG